MESAAAFERSREPFSIGMESVPRVWNNRRIALFSIRCKKAQTGLIPRNCKLLKVRYLQQSLGALLHSLLNAPRGTICAGNLQPGHSH
jgi:hypothetical protein